MFQTVPHGRGTTKDVASRRPTLPSNTCPPSQRAACWANSAPPWAVVLRFATVKGRGQGHSASVNRKCHRTSGAARPVAPGSSSSASYQRQYTMNMTIQALPPGKP